MPTPSKTVACELVTSTDAQTWTARLSGVTTWLRGLTYEPYRVSHQIGSNGSAQFYASGQGGVLLSSYDGLSWSKESSIFSQDIEALAQGIGGVGQDGTIARQSTVVYGPAILVGKGSPTNNSVTEYYMNIVLWSRFSIGIPARFRGLARGAGAVFAMGENGAIAAASDYNGPWATLASGTSANLVGAVFYNDTLYIVGENETILASDAIYPSRLANLSTRGRVTGESETLIAGFVIRGPEKKRVLLRVAGPALGALGVPGSLPRPALTLRDQAGRSLGANAGWGSGDAEAMRLAAQQAGAFPFAAGSTDAALLVTLDPGNYTAEVSGVSGAAGVALVEAYDLDPGSQTERKLINLSTRGNVGTDADKLIAGFVITGADSRRVLIRAIGPTLEAFGVSRALAEPKLELFNSRAQLQRLGETWSLAREPGALRAAATATGAFALADDSRDAALVATLPPGAYTVQVSGAGNATGAALVEIYEVP